MNALLPPTFDQIFGCQSKPIRPTDDTDARSMHVAELVPQLERIYAAHPEHISRAFDDVSLWLLTRHSALLAALAGDDHAEIGRLLKAAMGPYFRQQAEDTAEDDARTIYPEGI